MMESDDCNTCTEGACAKAENYTNTVVTEQMCQHFSEHVPTLDELPMEILMHICSFLEARIIFKLTKVCKVFQDLFSGDTYWKLRISKRWPKKYPPVTRDGVDWQQACIDREEAFNTWKNPSHHLEHFSYSDGLFAAVDVVHLFQNGQMVAAGSRDRYLTILDLKKYDVHKPTSLQDMNVYSDCKAHKGWIWSLASLDTTLATGSWDTYIRTWDLEAGCSPIDTFKCKSAILDLHLEPGLIVAGCYDKQICQIDPRSGHVAGRKVHKQPVLCIAVDDDFIIAGSEDKTISVYDRRAGKMLKVVQLDTYPLDMSYGDNQLWFGDRAGKLHLYNTTNGWFDLVEVYDVGHQTKVTGVIHTPGAIYTSSTDHTVKVLEPNCDPGTIATLTDHTGEVAGISYENGVLASAGCDISVRIWRPVSQEASL